MADLILTDYLETHRERITEALFSWLRIPSISADPDRSGDVVESAEFAAQQLREAGLEHVRLLATGDGTGAPAVYADWLHAGSTGCTSWWP
jgi:acetylornithine deacetylase/succinyl-diaminopimelate desuccinylase-like protein